MVLPVLQSLLTLGLLVAAFGFMARRFWHIGVLINTGARGDETLTDRPGERARTMLAYTLGPEAAEGRPRGGTPARGLPLRLPRPRPGPLRGRPRGPDLLPAGLRAPALPLRAGPSRRAELPSTTSARTCWPPRSSWPARSPCVRRFRGQPAAAPAAIEGRRERPLVHRRALRDVLRPRRRDRAAEAAGGAGTRRPALPAVQLARGPGLLRPGDAGGARACAAFGWWAHVLVFLGFAAYLPTTKHMHLVFGWPEHLASSGASATAFPRAIDFEKTEKFGIDRVQELPWKSLLDTFACTECGRCNSVCPAHATGKPLQPMKVLHDLKVNLRERNGADILKFRDARGRPLPGKAEEEAAFEPADPPRLEAEIDRSQPGVVRADGGYLQVDGQVHVRRALGLHHLRRLRPGLPGPHRLRPRRPHRPAPEPGDDGVRLPARRPPSAFKGMEVQGNPWGVGPDRRTGVGGGARRPGDGGARRARGGVPALGRAAPGPPTPGRARPTRPWCGS